MDAASCDRERLSSRTIGFLFLGIAAVLFIVGLVILPVVGFVFAVPLLVIGVAMLIAPESKACRLIRRGLRAG